MGRRGLNRSWWFLGGSVLWPIYWRIFQYGMACINSVTFFASEEVWRQFRNPAMGLIIMFELMIMVVVEFMVMLVSCVVRGCQKQNKGV